MSEIQFYGGASDSTASPFFGATAKAWSHVNSARTALNNSGIQVPYVYMMPLDEALEVNSKSFTFPLRVWVSHDEDVIYSTPQYAKDSKEFRKIVSEAPENSTFIVSRIPINHDNCILYLAHDGLIMKSNDRDFYYPFSADLELLWKRFNLPENLVLRLRWPHSPGGWVVDGLIDRDNEHVREYFGRPATDVSDEAFAAFRLGFINGYNAKCRKYVDYLHLNTPSLREYRISDNLSLAQLQGWCAGQEARHQFRQHFAAISAGGSEKDKIKAIASLNSDTISKLQNLGHLHNAVVDNNREEVSKRLAGFFSGHDASWFRVANFFHTAGHYFNHLAEFDLQTSYWNDYTEKLEFDVDIEFELIDSVNFDTAQFRIVKSVEGRIQIRFQSKNLSGKRIAVMPSGKTHQITSWDKKQVELTFDVSDWSLEKAKALSSLDFNLKSQANTGMMYAPCVIKDDMIVAVENGVEITSLNSLLAQVAAYFTA